MTVYEGISSFNDSTAQLNLAVLRTSEEIEAARAQWQALECRCQADKAYFQTFDWCSNWVRHIAPNIPGCEAHVVSVWQAGTLVAVVPLMQSRVAGGVRVLSALGDPHTQYAGMLLDPAACSASIAAMIRSYLDAPQDCDALYLELLPADSPLAAMLNPADRETAYVNQSSSLDLTQFDTPGDFLGDADPKKRRKRLQRRQKIEKEFGELRLRTVWGGEPEFEALVHRCVQMKQDWIAGTGRISTGFSIPGYADFLGRLHGDASTREGAVAFVKQVGDRIIAIEVSMIRRGHLYAYVGGFDWELRKLSPGKVQMEATVCWAIRNGLTAYDLLGNAAAYKDSWTNIACDLHAYSRAYTLAGWIYSSAWRTQMRPALKQIYNALPQGIRQWASWAAAS